MKFKFDHMYNTVTWNSFQFIVLKNNNQKSLSVSFSLQRNTCTWKILASGMKLKMVPPTERLQYISPYCDYSKRDKWHHIPQTQRLKYYHIVTTPQETNTIISLKQKDQHITILWPPQKGRLFENRFY
jgi:hypothetical protein